MAIGAPGVDRDLRGADLTGQDLRSTVLTGVDLTDARLSGADLRGCSLRGSTLEGAQFVGADLTGADLTDCRASGAVFGQADLTDTSFFGADLSGASLSSSTLHGADLRAADLDRARMREVDLTKADLSRATITEVDLTDAVVAGARFNDADLSRSELQGLKHFEAADWIGVSVLDIDFSGAYLVRREIMDQNYLFEFRTRDQLHSILYKVWKATSDCGRSVTRWAAMTVMVALLFAVFYTIVDIDYGPNRTALSPLYFSVVTITTLGYGDALPKSMVAQILVMLEVAVGYMMLGGVLSIFATRMGRRAD
jgi:uncharacterized protein YjbI with pentapeptide repeats